MKPFASNFGLAPTKEASSRPALGIAVSGDGFMGFGSCFGDFARDIVRALYQSGVFINIFAHLRVFS